MVVVHVVSVQPAERAYPYMALRVFGYGGDFLVGEVVGDDGTFDFGIPVFGYGFFGIACQQAQGRQQHARRQAEQCAEDFPVRQGHIKGF